jgi:hypothetical protein
LVLAELTNHRLHERLSTAVELIDSSLYADGAPTENEKLAAKSSLLESLSSICAAGSVTPIAALEGFARNVFPALSRRTALEGSITRRLASGLSYDCESIILDAVGRMGVPISIWITHDLEWLYPDDWRLWEFLRLSISGGRSPILIARKISPVTFSVLKAVRARGVQYYSFLSAGESIGHVTELAQEIGWIHTIGVHEIANHPAVDQLDLTVEAAQAPDSVSERHVEEARSLGLADPSTTSANGVKVWALSLGLTAPPVFWITLDRWIESHAQLSDQAKSTVGETETLRTNQASDPMKPLGFGRDTQVSRVPFTLR